MVEFRFEKMEVWHLAVELTDMLYQITRHFPEEERFGLTSQLRRSAVSIAANIAEGSSRFSDRDNLRFVEISYGSLMEVLSHIEIATRQSLISMEHREQVRTLGDQLARQLSGFANHLRKQQS